MTASDMQVDANPSASTISTKSHPPQHDDANNGSKTSSINADTKTPQDSEPPSDLVDWESETDPRKPMNWTKARKTKNIVIICYSTFLTSVTASPISSIAIAVV